MKPRMKETLEDTVLRLEGEVGVLREVVDLLLSACACKVAERYSGHLVDCPVPAAREILRPSDPIE